MLKPIANIIKKKVLMRKPLVLFFPKIMCMQSCKNILREAEKKNPPLMARPLRPYTPPPSSPAFTPPPPS